MRALIAAVALCACGPGMPDPQYRHPKLQNFATELAEAARAKDVRTLRALLRDQVTTGGLWFEDVTCMTRFAAPARVTGPALDELARCLVTLELEPSERVDSLPDVAIVTYRPGLELQARFVETSDGAWLNWIGYVARRDMADALPTISGAALESLRLDGDPHEPLAGPGAFDELAIQKMAYAWLKVCVDASGTVTGTHVREASSPKAARVFGAAARTWKFQPFVLRGQPTPVCAMVQMRYPKDKPPKVEKLPYPLPPEEIAHTNVPSEALGKRVQGVIAIAPDDGDRRRIHNMGVSKVIGAVHYCIDATGHVTRTTLVRSTGLPGYDRRLLAGVSDWAYAPYLDEGKPVGVCSAATFIYAQR